MTCPICLNHQAAKRSITDIDGYAIECEECGPFNVTHLATINLRSIDQSLRWKVSAWVNEHKPSPLTTDDVERAIDSRAPSIQHRADRMLRWLVDKFPAGKLFSINDLGRVEYPKDGFTHHGNLSSSRLRTIGWNQSLDEMTFMVTEVLCNELGLLVSQNNHDYQVSPKGLIYLEGRRDDPSHTGFCAMWFNNEVAPLWKEVIEPAIRNSGYEPLRIDNKEHLGKIDAEIVASIRSARFLVADYTGHRGGVYYEAGFAHGLGKPVVFMCREDAMKELHFDIRQYNCIVWKPDELESARTQLTNRIRATLGQGPLKVPE